VGLVLPLLLAAPRPAAACFPWAERVLAWDARADLYLLASWHDRDRPPPVSAAVTPNWYELRRISTGAQVAAHNCADGDSAVGAASVTRPCEWRTALAAALPRDFGARGEPFGAGRLRLRSLPMGADSELALEGRGRRGWRRLLWLEYRPRSPERVRTSITVAERAAGDVVLGLEAFARGGNCTNTTVRMLRLPLEDLEDPARPGRQRRLLAPLDEDAPFERWQTAADLGPLPPERLIPALVAAERAAHLDIGVRWWKLATAALDPPRLAALTTQLRARPDLPGIVARLSTATRRAPAQRPDRPEP
jgi:hypothetical protein